ncbi:hypothetical protein [Paraferrimonas sedimenticola]|uniref:Anti-sigma factor n=1 Tax=Paraferrimonas sedimenticola TaxID=375674 RepID=A0AA37RT26_9GAMM|nr:hypothetical protein [Paraferrimonas sedimenticola]GLP95161.1 anti-sigma factor [Paraferrimonas sedimenticola]
MSQQNNDLHSAIDQMPEQLQPNKDLWPAIERAIDTPAQAPVAANHGPWKGIAIAASLALVSVVSFLGGQQFSNSGNDTTQSLALLTLLQQQHQQALAVQGRGQFSSTLTSAQTQDPLYAGIEEVRQGAKTVLAQLQQDPNNLELLQLWLWLQQRELELVNQAQSQRLTRT